MNYRQTTMKLDIAARSVTDLHWLLADLHLGHKNVLRHDNRPWDDIVLHDAVMRAACAEHGRKNRTLWLLGDIASRVSDLASFMHEVKPQWGKIILIRGNHDDKVAWRHRDWFAESHESRYVRLTPDIKMYLSHYAHRTWRNSHHGSYHFHGHSHGALPRLGRSMDVGAPCVNYQPICLTECIRQLERQPHTNHH